MFYTRWRPGHTEMLAWVLLACGAAAFWSGEAAASPTEEAAEELETRCPGTACVVIEHEETVAKEAAELADALRIRLSPLGVRIVVEESGDRAAAAPLGEEETAAQGGGARPRLLWVVHLRRLSRDLFLVAVDNFMGAGAEDLVREVARGETENSTIWTISLMIEEIVTPYVEENADRPAVGAGLAIIEPPAVGGVAKPESVPPRMFPKLHLVGLGLVVTGVVTAGDFAVGPVVAVEGMFAPKFLASFSAGWAGFVEYAKGGLAGRAQYIPMEIGLGYRMYGGPAVELSAWTGLAMGFAVYRTESKDGGEPARTDVLFEPGILAALRLSFTVYGPLAFYIVGGVTVSFVRDVLENRGTAVYESGWVAPDVEVGTQLKF
jgi:hypothetical protein